MHGLHRLRPRAEGAELLAGGEAALTDSGGYFVAPTLFSTTSDELRIAREEIFGPVLVASPVRHARGGRRARQRRASTGSPRASGRATSAAPTASPRCCAPASVYINTWGVVDPSAPFGGFKASGIGREHGHDGLDAYLETQDGLDGAVSPAAS